MSTINFSSFVKPVLEKPTNSSKEEPANIVATQCSKEDDISLKVLIANLTNSLSYKIDDETQKPRKRQKTKLQHAKE